MGLKTTQVPKEVPMSDATCPPLRMRYSFEARCRAVGEMVAGASVHAAWAGAAAVICVSLATT